MALEHICQNTAFCEALDKIQKASIYVGLGVGTVFGGILAYNVHPLQSYYSTPPFGYSGHELVGPVGQAILGGAILSPFFAPLGALTFYLIATISCQAIELVYATGEMAYNDANSLVDRVRKHYHG